jgi:hypothetical protein
MSIAEIGPFTSLMESAAAAIAAGMLLGGFVAGLTALIRRELPRQRFDWIVLQGGYGGGAGAILATLADITFHHAF